MHKGPANFDNANEGLRSAIAGVYSIWNGHYGAPEAPEENTMANNPLVRLHDIAGSKQIWSMVEFAYSWDGDHLYNWAIPRTEIQKNENLAQNEGWIDYR